MVDYAKQSKNAIAMIDNLIEKGTMNRKEIQYLVIKQHGFSSLFVDKYINLRIENGYAEEEIIKIPDRTINTGRPNEIVILKEVGGVVRAKLKA